MPVEIAAVRGERFPEGAAETPAGELSSDPAEVPSKRSQTPVPYREVRTTVTLASEASREIMLECPFEPDRVLVDPDAKVLQVNRKLAVHRF